MEFLLNIPFLALLLLFAGLLLGHMIWGRGRSEDEERLGILHDKNKTLQSELEEQRRVAAQMESALQSNQQEAERFRESSAQLEQLKVQHNDLQSALAAAEHNASKVQTLSEKLQSHVSDFHRERDQFVDAVQIRLEDQSRQIERLSDERDSAVSDLGQIKSERSSLQSTCDHQARELDELREKYTKSSGQASEVAGELVELRQRLEVANSELTKEQHQREHLQSVLDGRKLEYEALMQDIEQLEGSFQKMCLQNEKLTEESSLLATLRIEHKEIQVQLERKQKELVFAKEERSEMEQELVRTAQRSQDIEASKLKAEKEVETLRGECDELTEQCDQQSKQLSVASKIAESKTKLETENQALIRAKSSIEEHVTKLEEERAQRAATLQELRTEREQFESHSDQLKSQVAKLEEERDHGAETLKELRAEIEDFSSQREILEGQVTTLERGRDELESELHELKGKYGESVKAHAYAVDECDELITSAERAEERSLKLEQEIERLENIVEARETDIADLQERLDGRDADLQELRSTDEQSLQKAEEAQQRIDELLQQVSSLSGVNSELEDDTKTLQSKFDSKCEEIVALAASRDEVTESYRDAQEQLLDVQRRLVDSEEQRSKLDEMVVEYRGRVDSSKQELETLSGDRDEVSSRLDAKLDEIESLTAKLHSLETSKGASDSAYGALKERYDQTQTELLDSQKVREEISESHQELQEELLGLKRAADEMRQSRESVEGELKALKDQYAERAKELAEVTVESERAVADCKESEATVLVLREQIRQLEEIHGANDVDVAELRARFEEKERELNDAVEAREELVATNKAAEDKITRLEVKVQQLEKVRSEANEELSSLREKLSEVGDLKRNLADQNRRLEVLVAERDGAAKSKSAVDLRIQQLETEIERQNKSFTTINQQHEQLRAKLKLESERYELAAAELETQRERVVALESELEEFEALKQEHVELQSQLTGIKDRLRKLVDERDSSVKAKRDLERQVASLRNHNVANEDTIRDLRRERLAVIERLRNRAVAAQGGETGLKLVRYHDDGLEAADASSAATSEPSIPANMRHDERLGMVYTEAPTQVDDLKEIYGIAGVLEGKLNDFGVYTYQQIMDWDDATVEEFSARLAFKDRIERDGWILQATRLHDAKYNPSKKAA